MRGLRRILTGLAVLLAIFTLTLPQQLEAANKEIIILYTNDIHCAVQENMAKIAQYKKDLLQETPYVILVDAGDAVQGTPLGRLTQGEAIVRLMNLVGYDFAIPGNHEFDYGMENFRKLREQLECGYYSANFLDRNTGEPVLPSYKLLQLGDKRIALIGVTTPATLSSAAPAFFQNAQGEFIYSFCEDEAGESLYRVIQKNIDEVRAKGADYVFLVSHLGARISPYKWSSIAVASHVTGLDAIIDGHSHEAYPAILVQDKAGKRVLITQTGSHLQQLGKLSIAPEGYIENQLIKDLQQEDPQVRAAMAQEEGRLTALLGQKAGRATVTLMAIDEATGKRIVRSHEANIGNFAADALREVLQADVALLNGGGIRRNLPQGELSYQDFYQAFPFVNECLVKEVTGQQLLDALEVGAKALPWETGGFLQVSGMSYTIDTSLPSAAVFDPRGGFVQVQGPYRVREVYVNGKPLNLRQSYTVASNAYLLRDGGNGMTMFKDCKTIKKSSLLDVEIFIEYLQSRLCGTINGEYRNPYGVGRINIL